MKSIKKIKTNEEEVKEIKGLVEVYEQIAASKMQDIRGDIITARDFFDRLAGLSSEVGADLEAAGLGEEGEVAVFVSSQTGLYGDIIDKIFVDFMEFVNKNPKVEKVVFGKLGESMLSSLAPNIKYQYYDLVNEQIDQNMFSEVVKTLVKFKKIYLFYGKFNNIVNQETSTSVLSGQTLAEMQTIDKEQQKFLYLYEPSVETISKVFSEEIAGSVIDQAFKESQLARLASRLMYLDSSIEKCDEKLVGLSAERTKAKRRNNERKQMVSFASIGLI